MEMDSRIELYERYVSNALQVEYLEHLGVPSDKLVHYRYRRTNPRLEDIERVIEIEGNKKECIVRFYGGYDIVVKANFDALCILFNDMCNGEMSE